MVTRKMTAKVLGSVLVILVVFVSTYILAEKCFASRPSKTSPPVAELTVDPQYAVVDQDITLDGTDSHDGDTRGQGPEITLFQWDVDYEDGDPDWLYEQPTGVATHTYACEGTYTVLLRVTDNDTPAATDEVECTVYVGPRRVHNVTQSIWYSHIQHAIDKSVDEDIIQATEGTYYENINFKGKDITVESDPANTTMPVIDGDFKGSVVTFAGNEGTSSPCKLTGFKITDGCVGEPTENLVSHWKLDETIGDSEADDSVDINYGTLVHMTGEEWTEDGQIGGALQFDGVDDYVEMRGNIYGMNGYRGITGTGQRTTCAWFKTVSSAKQAILGYGDMVDGGRWSIWVNTDGSIVNAMVGGNANSITKDLNDGQWHHVAVTLPGGGAQIKDVKIYVDGRENIGSFTDPDDMVNTGGDYYFKIGINLDGVSFPFKGVIDDVRIYDRALSESEIGELAGCGNEPISHWKFDEIEGSTVAMDSAGNNHGDLANMTYDEWTTGQFGGALEFDGENDHVNLGETPDLEVELPLTMMTWVKLETTPSADMHTIKIGGRNSLYPDNYYGTSLRVTATGVRVMYCDGGPPTSASRRTKSGTTILETDRWYHIAGVIRGPQDMDIYIDGEDDGGTYSGTGGDLVYGDGISSIGSDEGQLGFFNGTLDDVRIYDHALSDGEINRLYLGTKAGGGILGNRTSANISNCVIEGNTAGYGGGIYGVNGDITNCIIAGNTADSVGGGLHSCGGDIINCTIVGNTALEDSNGDGWLDSDGSGVYECDKIKNCIIYNNRPYADQLYQSSDPCYSCTEGWTGGGKGNIDEDYPLSIFVDAENVDADNNDYHLKRNSVCKNVGDPCGVYTGQKDIDGQPRVAGVKIGDTLRVDMGADEVCEVHNTTQNIWYETINAAIDNANDWDDIVVYPFTYEENVSIIGEKPIEVRSTNPDDWDVVAATVIDGHDFGNAVVFSSRSPYTGSLLTGFTITGGNPCGIWCGNVSPTISRCIITGNDGSGIKTFDNWAVVDACKIHNNSAYGIRFLDGSAMVKNSWIYENNIGILTGTDSSPIIANNTIVDNFTMGISSGAPGGTATPTITNCIIRGNSNDLYGGLTATYSCVPTEDLGDPETTYNIDDDPNFMFEALNNYHLSYGSPCIDAGYPFAWLGETDIDGDDRVLDGDNDGEADVDMGADEYKWPAEEGPVRIYTNDQYSGPPLTDCQVHFGASGGTGSKCFPDLYIEIDSDGASPIVLKVTSESDRTGIDVNFEETGENTNIFRTTDPIHLAENSNQIGLELKVMDEEILCVGGVPGPKVDRGEIAAITGDGGSDDPCTACTASAGATNHLVDWLTTGGYGWWNNGELNGPLRCNNYDQDVFQSFIKNAGNGLSEADMLFEVSHGLEGDLAGSCLVKPGGDCLDNPDSHLSHCGGGGDCERMDPSSDWNEDVEWVVLYSCWILGEQLNDNNYSEDYAELYIEYWDDMLLNGCHGILSSSAKLSIPTTEDLIESFCTKLDSETVIDAYINSAVEKEEWAAAALFHSDNTPDRIGDVTPDTTDTTMYYTYFIYGPPYPHIDKEYEALGTWSSASGDSTSETERIELDDGLVIITCDIPTEQPKLSKIKAQKESLTKKDFDCKEFTETEFDNHGRIKLKKPYQDRAQERPIGLTKEQSKEKSKDFIREKGGGLPDDAELTFTVDQMVQIFDSKNPADIQNSYVKKRILEYGHNFNGIEIVGGNRGDNITVEIEDGEVVSLKRHWRDIQGSVGTEQNVISARDALDVAVENLPPYISSSRNKEYRISSIKLFYYGLPSEEDVQHLTPAWGFLVGQHTWVYVNAFTGELLY